MLVKQQAHCSLGLGCCPAEPVFLLKSSLALHRALRRTAGRLPAWFPFLVFWALAGACQRHGVGGFYRAIPLLLTGTFLWPVFPRALPNAKRVPMSVPRPGQRQRQRLPCTMCLKQLRPRTPRTPRMPPTHDDDTRRPAAHDQITLTRQGRRSPSTYLPPPPPRAPRLPPEARAGGVRMHRGTAHGRLPRSRKGSSDLTGGGDLGPVDGRFALGHAAAT